MKVWSAVVLASVALVVIDTFLVGTGYLAAVGFMGIVGGILGAVLRRAV